MGTRWNRLSEAVLMSTHNLCFEQNLKNNSFLSENFQFSETKFSINLNKRVVVMNNSQFLLIRCSVTDYISLYKTLSFLDQVLPQKIMVDVLCCMFALLYVKCKKSKSYMLINLCGEYSHVPQ